MSLDLSLNKIKLRKGWDLPTHYDKVDNIKIHRRYEEELIRNFIQHRKEGSLLISGKTGSGKSTLMHRVMNGIPKNIYDKIIMVPVNATSLENRKPLDSDYEDFLSLKQSLLKNLLSELFESESKINHKSILPKQNVKPFDARKKKKVTKTSQNPTSDYQEINQEDEEIDYESITNLERRLENELERIHKVGYKVCFIIDEVDKLDEVDEEKLKLIINHMESKSTESFDPRPRRIGCVMDVAKSLKTLINTNHALFIFITSEKMYEALINVRNNSRTIFSETLFLQRPSFELVNDFFQNILDNNKLTDSIEYEMFKHYVCYIAHNNFHDVYRYIKDFVTDGNLTTLNIEKFSAGQKFIAKLHKNTNQIFNKKKYTRPTNFMKNELLLEKMYATLEIIINLTDSEDLVVENSETKVIITGNNHSVESADPKPSDHTQRVSLLDLIFTLRENGVIEEKTSTVNKTTYGICSKLRGSTEIAYDWNKLDRENILLANEIVDKINNLPLFWTENNFLFKKINETDTLFLSNLHKVMLKMHLTETDFQDFAICYDPDRHRRYTIEDLIKIRKTADNIFMHISDKVLNSS